jgi:hypothetical protein
MFTENTDTGHEAIAQLLAALELMYPDHQGFVVAELIARLYPPDGIRTDDNQAAVMRAAIENLVGGSASRPPTARQLGNRLRSCRRRVVNGLYVDVCEEVRRAGGTVWRLWRTTSSAGRGETV